MSQPITVSLEYEKYSLGCEKADQFLLKAKDILHELPGEFSVVKCNASGLMRTNPRPTPETIGFYYPDDYAPYIGTQVKQIIPKPPRPLIKRFLKPLVNRSISFNTGSLPSMPVGDMLDLGCASGAFMHQMANQGCQVEGIEFSKDAAEAASKLGYKVYAGSLEDAPTPEMKFDLVTAWMVIKHLHEPIQGLRKLQKCTKPGGWLVFSVPNANFLEFKIFKGKWYALQLPTHLYHYTPQSIQKVLEASGWILVEIHHQRVLNNLIASIGYILRDKGLTRLGRALIDFPKISSKWKYGLYPLAWLLSLFGQTGRMTIWARKENET